MGGTMITKIARQVRRGLCLAPLIAAGLAIATRGDAAEADGAWSHEVVYTVDVTGVVGGASTQAGRFLDNLDIILDGDLEKAAGWRGAKLHLYLLNNSGGEPNNLAGTLQGVDNIEVGRHRARLYELWIDQGFADGRGSVLAGLYDVNSEFYSTETSGVLIAPPFGIGSELAATGPNGPSIFPSTSLAARVRLGDPDKAYVQAAVVNADAGALGDPKGIDTDFDKGALLIAEADWRGPARFVVGAWRYDRRQDDIRATTPSGEPTKSVAQGAYVLAEGLIHEASGGQAVHAFMRAGISDGDTSPFNGGWQTGLRVDRVFASRPDSAFSIGVHQGLIADKARANARDAGISPADSEAGLEITYSDTIGRLTVQPDLQVVRHPGGDRGADHVMVAAIRFAVDLD
jgi:porin